MTTVFVFPYGLCEIMVRFKMRFAIPKFSLQHKNGIE